MKRFLTALGLLIVFGISSTFVSFAAAPVGSDTLADWELKVPSYPNTMSVLDGEDGNYYIYPAGERGIPYVMIHAYTGFGSEEEFLQTFTDEVMVPNYPDLVIVADIAPVTIDGSQYYETDYMYTVSGNDCIDRRIARTVGDWTYMFASKEIPGLDLTVDTLLEDTIADSVFLALGEEPEVLPEPEPYPAPDDGFIPEINWTPEIEAELTEEGIVGSFYTFDEVSAMVWIPDFMSPVTLGPDDKEMGYLAYFADEDWSKQLGVQYIFIDMTQDEYLDFIKDQPQVDADNVKEFLINDIPFIFYSIPENDVKVLSTVTNAGYAMEFSFFPASDEDFISYMDFIGASIQPES